MIDDLELKAVQLIRQETDQDFVRQKIAGLDGTLHQKLGRASHRVLLQGYLLPATATDDLKTLQEKASSGAEVTFTADITTALSIQKMVIESFYAEQQVGIAGQTAYRIVLAESPPLPPPAEVSAFGGLGDFGLGDLGFDAGALGGVLGDISNAAGEIASAADAALDAVDKLKSLANLGNLASVGNPVKPLADQVGTLKDLGDAMKGLGKGLLG
ncbi:MAG TPA: hypothetical protein VFZ25_03900 [Chloroflexota bacterium]|nr:hypothetical protein [Chloroflexota bacterium]